MGAIREIGKTSAASSWKTLTSPSKRHGQWRDGRYLSVLAVLLYFGVWLAISDRVSGSCVRLSFRLHGWWSPPHFE